MESKKLLASLESRVDPVIVRELMKTATSHEGFLSLDDLNRKGLVASFNEAALEIHVDIPPIARKSSVISVRGEVVGASPESLSHPANASAFVTINAGQDFTYGKGIDAGGTINGGTTGRLPVHAELDGAINVHSWVLEASSSVSEDPTQQFVRGDVRLVKDNPDGMLRYSVGDLNYPVTGFQQFLAMGGVSGVTNFNLQPQRTVTPINAHEIFLKNRSLVKIWINGRIVQTLDLPAGRHDVRNFPVSLGLNELSLEITDDVGRHEMIKIPYLFSDQLLAPGIQQLSYAIGAPSIQTGSSRNYLSSEPVFSFSHRAGILENLTLGAYFQADRFQGIEGLNSTWLTPAGTWSEEPAISQVGGASDSRFGFGNHFGYLYTDYVGVNRAQRNFGLAVESKTPLFAVLGGIAGNFVPSSAIAHDLTGVFSQQFLERTTFNFSSRLGLYRSPAPGVYRPYSLSPGLSRSWISGLDTTLTLTHTVDQSGVHATNLLFLLTWAMPEKNQYITAIQNTENEQSRVEWNYASNHAVGGINAAVGIERNDLNRLIDGHVNYTGNRGTAGVAQNSSVDNNGLDSHRTSLSAGTSLVFADGAFAVSRPVTDSFVVVKPEEAFVGQRILLNPQSQGNQEPFVEARTDWLGPGVIPDLVSYRQYQLNLSAPDTPPGLHLPRENYVIAPTYKSGTTLRITSDSAVFARGVLVGVGGQLLALFSGEVRSLTDPHHPVGTLFTNRHGKFSLEGMKAGRYHVQSYEGSGSAEFEIPAHAKGIVELGQIKLGSEP